MAKAVLDYRGARTLRAASALMPPLVYYSARTSVEKSLDTLRACAAKVRVTVFFEGVSERTREIGGGCLP